MRRRTVSRLHNAMWPGLVGKGARCRTPIDLDTMLDLTANAPVDGVKFDGVDLFLFDPHVSIDSTRRRSEAARRQDRAQGSASSARSSRRSGRPPAAARRWAATTNADSFVTQVRKACADRQQAARPRASASTASSASIPPRARRIGRRIRPATPKTIADTFREACDVAEEFGERLAAEGEICWGGMHSWKRNVELLELVDRPKTLGFQADMAHTLLFTMGYNAPEDRLLPERFRLVGPATRSTRRCEKMTPALRPWTIDFHVAQNDATVKGSGSHDKTGRHCLPNDPNGKLDIVRHAGYWMRDDDGTPTRAVRSTSAGTAACSRMRR